MEFAEYVRLQYSIAYHDKEEIPWLVFLVPAAEAVVTTIVSKTAKKEENPEKIPMSRKLKWLSNLLWGGSALLCFEHVWHGEVVPWFPFLTAMSDPEETTIMLHEMVSVGDAMAVWLTVIWTECAWRQTA